MLITTCSKFSADVALDGHLDGFHQQITTLCPGVDVNGEDALLELLQQTVIHNVDNSLAWRHCYGNGGVDGVTDAVVVDVGISQLRAS